MTETTLINKVWNYATIMKDAGLSYTDYVRQLTYLLFLKMDYERETLLGEGSIVPAAYRWDKLLSLSGAELEAHYSKTLETLSKEKGIIGTIFRRAKNEITEPAKLKQLISLINKETWLALDMDVKGAIYEGLLQKTPPKPRPEQGNTLRRGAHPRDSGSDAAHAGNVGSGPGVRHGRISACRV